MKDSDGHSSPVEKTETTEQDTSEPNGNLESVLDISDLGAGYDAQDKHVARSINFYQEELLPFLRNNSNNYKLGNFLSIKGYGVNIKKKYRPTGEAEQDRQDTSNTKRRKSDPR